MGDGITVFGEIHRVIPRQPPNELVEADGLARWYSAAGNNSYRGSVVKVLDRPAAYLQALDGTVTGGRLSEQRLVPRARRWIGEFVVIVAGVLVALAVDQWRDAREDRVAEARYLDRLRADLEWDTANFAQFERVALHAKAAVLRELLAEDAPDRLTARRTLIEDLNYSGFIALPANRPATFEELQNTGNLSLLQDIELRGALSHYYSGFDHISRILAQPFGDYRRRLEAALPGDLFYDWRLDGADIARSDVARGVERLLASPGLKEAVNSELAYTAGMTFYLREYHRQAVKLLAKLDEM